MNLLCRVGLNAIELGTCGVVCIHMYTYDNIPHDIRTFYCLLDIHFLPFFRSTALNAAAVIARPIDIGIVVARYFWDGAEVRLNVKKLSTSTTYTAPYTGNTV